MSNFGRECYPSARHTEWNKTESEEITMKKWIVTHTHDAVVYKNTEIKGTSYTDAFVNFMVAYPNETVCKVKEV